MRPFRPLRHLPAAALLATTALLAVAGPGLLPALAQTAAAPPPASPPVPAAPVTTSPATVLLHLPANTEALTFRGESAARSFTLPFSRTEAARATTLQVALSNTVSVLPERSSVRVAVNGQVLATVPADAADRAALLSLRLPPGLLAPGANTVTVTTALTHRVDCSIKATYELWAALDPARTGFVLPREAGAEPRPYEDLAAEPLAEDGTTRIHLRLPDNAAPDDIADAVRVVGALARRANLVRPLVSVGPEAGEGPGFDLLLDGQGAGDLLGRLAAVTTTGPFTTGRDPATGRLAVVLTGPLGERNRASGLDSAVVQGGSATTLKDLGFDTVAFAGRHYTGSLTVDLPADFFPANDRARLLLDGSTSASLAEGSSLVFRVNGKLVSTLALPAGRAATLDREIVELPLRFFHPGRNTLAIEGSTASAADAACDLATMPHEARLTLAGTSTLEMPTYARLATLPQLPAALTPDAAAGPGPLHLYLADGDRATLGAALTVVANLPAGSTGTGAPVVRLGGPGAGDAPGLVVAAGDQLPSGFLGPLQELVAAPDEQSGSADQAADLHGSGLPRQVEWLSDTARRLLQARGFFFQNDKAARLPVTDTTLLVATLAPDRPRSGLDRLALPQVTRDPSQWLVVTAPTTALAETGVSGLVAQGHWSELSGQAISFDVAKDALHTAPPRRLAYVMPGRVVVSDIRPILGGIVSNNIAASLGLLVVLMGLLGVSTHALIRRMGVRS